jgi:tripartite-type tricarboxylate transporter receptor subunit TctC
MKSVLAALLLAILAVSGPPAQAQVEKPIHVIVPFAAGGPTDVVARVLAPRLSEALKRSVVVENKVGATGAIGAALVAHSIPDGDTLLLGTSSIMAANPNLTPNLPFDPVRDFAPISLIASVESVLVVNPSVPADNVQQLIAYAKAHPGKLTYASSGIGSTYHLAGELFCAQAGIKMTHIPYKGAAPAIQDVLAGHVDAMFDNVSSAIANLKAGRVRALGVAALQRYPALGEIPTIAEQGLPGYQTTIWIALFAPAATPPAVLANLQRAVAEAVQSPDYRDKLAAIDMQPRSSTPQELADYLKSELAKWAKVVKDAGIKPES